MLTFHPDHARILQQFHHIQNQNCCFISLDEFSFHQMNKLVEPLIMKLSMKRMPGTEQHHRQPEAYPGPFEMSMIKLFCEYS